MPFPFFLSFFPAEKNYCCFSLFYFFFSSLFFFFWNREKRQGREKVVRSPKGETSNSFRERRKRDFRKIITPFRATKLEESRFTSDHSAYLRLPSFPSTPPSRSFTATIFIHLYANRHLLFHSLVPGIICFVTLVSREWKMLLLFSLFIYIYIYKFWLIFFYVRTSSIAMDSSLNDFWFVHMEIVAFLFSRKIVNVDYRATTSNTDRTVWEAGA